MKKKHISQQIVSRLIPVTSLSTTPSPHVGSLHKLDLIGQHVDDWQDKVESHWLPLMAAPPSDHTPLAFGGLRGGAGKL